MCGIVGAMSTNLGFSDTAYLRQLMVLSVLRGWDGSGAFAVYPHHKKLRIDMQKSELCAAELAADPKFSKMVDSNNTKIVCAHARAPTRGGLDLPAVHPHRVGALTGVHNGTMLTVMNKSIPDKESDSLSVFTAIHEHGVEEFIKNSRGAYSLVWTNAAESTLNFLRNDQRPMVFARIGNGDFAHTMFWASEQGMLEFVLNDRGNISKNVTNYMGPKPWQFVQFPLNVKQGMKPSYIHQFEDPFKTMYSRGVDYHKEYEAAWAEFDKRSSATEVNDNKTSGSVIPLPDRSVHFRGEDQTPTSSGSTNNTAYRGPNNHRQMARDVLQGVVGANRADPRSLPKVEELLGRRVIQSSVPVTFQDRPVVLLELIKRFGCAICDNKPKPIATVQNGEPCVEAPKIHIVKFGNHGMVQYICDECVEAKNHLALTVLGSQLAATGSVH